MSATGQPVRHGKPFSRGKRSVSESKASLKWTQAFVRALKLDDRWLRLPPVGKLATLELAQEHVDAMGVCWRKQGPLADALGVSRDAVNRGLGAAEEVGLLRQDYHLRPSHGLRGQTASTYTFDPAIVDRANARCGKSRHPAAASSPGVASHDTRHGVGNHDTHMNGEVRNGNPRPCLDGDKGDVASPRMRAGA